MEIILLPEWFEPLNGHPLADWGAMIQGIVNYAVSSKIPEPSDLWGTIGVAMSRRMIDQRRRKSAAGAKGGKASGKSRRKADGEAEIKPNEADGEAEREADGEHDKKERKERKDKKEGIRATRGAREVDFDTARSWADTHFCPPPPDDFLRMFIQRMTESGWLDRNGRPLDKGRWQRELSVWWNREKEKKSAARALPADAATPVDAQGLPVRLDSPEPDMI